MIKRDWTSVILVVLIIVGAYCAFVVYEDSKAQQSKDNAADRERAKTQEQIRRMGL